jgi:4a-hydroxytetrahydrobiopterin dehydratase
MGSAGYVEEELPNGRDAANGRHRRRRRDRKEMIMKVCTIKGLARQGCAPCRGGVAPLKGAALKELVQVLGHRWKVVKNHHLEKTFGFEDFRSALDFTNRVGQVAETQNHHPDIYLAWGQVKITIWTHKIDGLTESDFALAALIEQLK